MGQKRIKLFDETEAKAKALKEKKEKKKSARVPGLKGGQRVVMITGDEPKPPKEKAKPIGETSQPEAVGERLPRRPKKKGQPGRGKRYQEAISRFDQSRSYPLPDAVRLVKQTSVTRFPATVEVHLNLKKDQREFQGTVKLPHGTGKEKKILVFGPQGKGADLIGDEKLIAQISSGQLPNVDVILATPEWMPKLAKIAKFLGPKGLMPNPKAGTVTKDPEQEIKKIRQGYTGYRTEPKTPIIHFGVGRTDWEETKLVENLGALLDAIGLVRVAKLTLSATMGPGIKVVLE